MRTPRTPDSCRSSIGGYISQIATPREVGKFKRVFCKCDQTSPLSKQKVGRQAVASNQEADGYFWSHSHQLSGFREEKILSKPIRDVQLVGYKGIELLG
ncbi:uncharacterized protein LOC135586274 isoform X4 [Musa acuminata AAA Group]|uniref:uncharacterized protein LOC103969858 isoform X5 n=1 Tax=Musa acuminata AAA Group TaxID=214697 RepID=UPI0031DD8018